MNVKLIRCLSIKSISTKASRRLEWCYMTETIQRTEPCTRCAITVKILQPSSTPTTRIIPNTVSPNGAKSIPSWCTIGSRMVTILGVSTTIWVFYQKRSCRSVLLSPPSPSSPFKKRTRCIVYTILTSASAGAKSWSSSQSCTVCYTKSCNGLRVTTRLHRRKNAGVLPFYVILSDIVWHLWIKRITGFGTIIDVLISITPVWRVP